MLYRYKQLDENRWVHKVDILYTKSTTVYVSSSELGPPTPSPANECAHPPEQKGRGEGDIH